MCGTGTWVLLVRAMARASPSPAPRAPSPAAEICPWQEPEGATGREPHTSLPHPCPNLPLCCPHPCPIPPQPAQTWSPLLLLPCSPVHLAAPRRSPGSLPLSRPPCSSSQSQRELRSPQTSPKGPTGSGGHCGDSTHRLPQLSHVLFPCWGFAGSRVWGAPPTSPGLAARGSPVTWKGCVEDAPATGQEPGTALGVSPRPDCSRPALPWSQHRTATGRSSLASPRAAGFKSQLAGHSGTAPCSTMMPGAGTLVLVLLTLCVELPPAPAQQQRAGDHGAAPAASPPPRRAPRGRRPPATPPAPGKAGECPAAGSGPLRPTRLYCLSDHSCPGAEKCCRRGKVRACLLPATESPGYCPRAGPSGASCGASCGNDTACGPAEKCCARSCCARCLPAEPAKPGLCPRKRARRGAAACPSRCADDRDCPGDRKCCFSGCGLACTSPHTAKPGVCPVVLRGSLGPCEELCDTDGDCPGARKCCSTGCGHVCKPPTEGKADRAAGGARPRHVPILSPATLTPPCWVQHPFCPPSALGAAPHPAPPGGRGAHPPAGRAAPSPAPSLHVRPARPGLCPPAAAGVGAGECLILCLEDKDCPPSQKCCLRDCGRACVPPLQGTA
uniref:WAP domain-containing protein n=1 Tax=Anser cygnoides TaxID=8845 RepID=A0A8B9IPC1_ANSCY